MGASNIQHLTPQGAKLCANIDKLAGNILKVGYFRGKANYDDDAHTDVIDVAIYNELGTSTIPPRPFMSQAIKNYQHEINAFLEGEAKSIAKGADPQQTLNRIGLFIKGVIQKEMVEGDFVPNSPSTIKRKGSSKPLIDTGTLRNSIHYVIERSGR